MKEKIFWITLVLFDSRLTIFLPIPIMLTFCHLAPIAEPADSEVSSACPNHYPDKLIMYVLYYSLPMSACPNYHLVFPKSACTIQDD
mgnify:CR=1 FL=1